MTLPNNQILGSWSVYIGDPRPNSAKITGKLNITPDQVCFDASLQIDENAAAAFNLGIKAFESSNKKIVIPFNEIKDVQVLKKIWILKILRINLIKGGTIDFQFGAASATEACELIKTHLK
jgi:hypothetical protein